MKRKLSLVILLLLLCLPLLAASPRFSAEKPLGTTEHGPAFNTQGDPQVAAGPDGFFAVWYDGRKANTIFGTRLDAAGRVLDPTGIIIGPGVIPDVVAIPDGYIAGRITDCGRIQLTKISPAGELSPFGATLGSNTQCAADLNMAVAGDRLLLVWRQGEGVHTAVMSVSSGAVLSSALVLGLGPINYVDAASNGHDFMIAAIGILPTGLEVPQTVRVSADGTLSERLLLGTFTVATGIAVAWNGSEYLVAWTGIGVAGQFVTADNAISGPRLGFLAMTGTHSPSLEGYGAGALLTYTREGRRAIARIDPSGAALETDSFPGDNTVSTPVRVAFDGRRFLAVWADGGDVFGALLDGATATRRDTKPLTESAREQLAPAIASDGAGGSLAVWNEYDNGFVLRGQISRRDGSSVPVPTLAALPAILQPSVVFDGAAYDVIWNDGTRVVLRRVSRDGVALDAEPVEVAPDSAGGMAAAAGGGSVLVVWPEASGIGTVLSASIVTAGVPSPPFVLSAAGQFAVGKGRMSAAWDGSQFFVVWQQEPANTILLAPPVPQPVELRGARVTKGGTVLDPAGIELAPARVGRGPSGLASNGSELLVVWSDTINGSRQLRATRVASDGSVVASDVPLADLANDQQQPLSLVFDGNSYVLAWLSGAEYFVQRLTADAKPIGVPVSVAPATAGFFSAVALTAPTPRDLSVVYTRMADEPQYGSVIRVFARTATPDGKVRAIR